MIHRRTRRGRRRGAVAVVVALCLIPLIGIMAFAFDGGLMLAAKRRSQTIADTSAHAAAVRLYTNAISDPTGLDVSRNAWSTAMALAATNGYNNDGTTNTVKVNIPPLSGTFLGKPFHAEVIVTTIQPRIFSAVLGSGSLTVGAYTVARGISGTAQAYSNASLIVLSAAGCGSNALQVSGGASLDTQSTIQDNSTSSIALNVNGGASLTAPSIQIAGSYSATGGSTINGTIQTSAPIITDPLASLPAPNPSTLTARSFQSSSSTQTINPGVYSNGLQIGNGGTVTMNPGVYYLQGIGLNIGNGATLTGNGVTIYMDNGAQLNLQGGTSVTLTPPTSGTYAGLTYFQSRSSILPLNINNGATLEASGTIYAPAATANIIGGTTNKYGSQLILDTLNISNGAKLTMPTKTDATKGYVASGTSTASITLVE